MNPTWSDQIATMTVRPKVLNAMVIEKYLMAVLLPSECLENFVRKSNIHGHGQSKLTERASSERIGAPLLKTLRRYASSCWSNVNQHGRLTIRVLIPSALSLDAAS